MKSIVGMYLKNLLGDTVSTKQVSVRDDHCQVWRNLLSLSEMALKLASENLLNQSCTEEQSGLLHIISPCLLKLTVQIHNVFIIMWRQSLQAGRRDATKLDVCSRSKLSLSEDCT